MPKSFDELTFADDWMFQKVLHNPEISSELVERLLHIRVDHVISRTGKSYSTLLYNKRDQTRCLS